MASFMETLEKFNAKAAQIVRSRAPEKPELELICPVCGFEFLARESETAMGEPACCSEECERSYRHGLLPTEEDRERDS